MAIRGAHRSICDMGQALGYTLILAGSPLFLPWSHSEGQPHHDIEIVAKQKIFVVNPPLA